MGRPSKMRIVAQWGPLELDSFLLNIISWSKDALPGFPSKFKAGKRKRGKFWSKGKKCSPRMPFYLQRETLYSISQNYAMWPPLSCKGGWEVGNFCFLAWVIDEDKGEGTGNCFGELTQSLRHRNDCLAALRTQPRLEIINLWWSQSAERLSHLTIKLVKWKKWQLYTKFHWLC